LEIALEEGLNWLGSWAKMIGGRIKGYGGRIGGRSEEVTRGREAAYEYEMGEERPG
jgi:hypothetical protein